MNARAKAKVLRYPSQRWVGLVWLTLAVVGVVVLTGCRRVAPATDPTPAGVHDDATISGTVRGPLGTSAIDGRVVEAVNVETGERHRMSTNAAGSFAFRVKPGRYRVELALKDGESLVRQPGIIDMQRPDGDASADFVLGTVRVSRPRGPAYRTDDGLGSPIA